MTTRSWCFSVSDADDIRAALSSAEGGPLGRLLSEKTIAVKHFSFPNELPKVHLRWMTRFGVCLASLALKISLLPCHPPQGGPLGRLLSEKTIAVKHFSFSKWTFGQVTFRENDSSKTFFLPQMNRQRSASSGRRRGRIINSVFDAEDL